MKERWFIMAFIVTSLLCVGVVGDVARASTGEAVVLSVVPQVSFHAGGVSTPLEVRMRVPVKSTVVSDASGRAQLMFPDATTVSIAPGSEIALTEFIDDPDEENILLDMAVGTARFITGDVSRKRPSAMTVNTPQASIGIRGTMVTVSIRGGKTMVYLTETSGRGVSVTNRMTGERRDIVKPGNIILVGPKEMEERRGTLEEVRSMTVALHSRPAPMLPASLGETEAAMNIRPAGPHAVGGVMDATYDAATPGRLVQNDISIRPGAVVLPVVPSSSETGPAGNPVTGRPSIEPPSGTGGMGSPGTERPSTELPSGAGNLDSPVTGRPSTELPSGTGNKDDSATGRP